MNVALGGGGAKGFVHVGVLEALVNRGYNIRSIVGTSIGAIVGSLFAYNVAVRYKSEVDPQRKAIQALEHVFKETNFLRLFDFNWRSPIQGPVRGAKIEAWLAEHLLDPKTQDPITFYDLPFDLHLTATDCQTGDPLDLCHTKCPATAVSTAVRASMSIQGVFPPETVTYLAKQVACWDGGTTGNCRFDLAHRIDPTRLTVGSSVTYRGEPTLPRGGILKTVGKSADVWLRQIENVTADLLGPSMKNILVVRPDLGTADTFTFWIGARQRERLFRNGSIATKAALDDYEGRA